MPTSILPSQVNIRVLSVPDLQPIACAQDIPVDHGAFSRCGSAKSQHAAILEQDAYVPVNYIHPEVYALLAAAEASAARCANAMDVEVMDQEGNGYGSTLQSEFDVWRVPSCVLLSTAPPKRFYRNFWRSISHRLLQRWAHEARPFS